MCRNRDTYNDNLKEVDAISQQVTCINKRPSHYAAHERIQNIGGAGWKHYEDQAIRNVKTAPSAYYVSTGGRTVRVIVATHNGREYLKKDFRHAAAHSLGVSSRNSK